jgi:hypothetical protein
MYRGEGVQDRMTSEELADLAEQAKQAELAEQAKQAELAELKKLRTQRGAPLPMIERPLKSGIRNADNEEPRFDDGDEKKSHDVVERCPNGKIRGRSTAAIYVIVRVNLDSRGGGDVDADVLGYSYDANYGQPFMEIVAAKDAFNVFWSYEKNLGRGPCFDPVGDDGEDKPLPAERFMMWDDIKEDLDGVPSMTVAAITIYEAAEAGTDPNDARTRRAIRRYKFMKAELTINDYMAIETSGDQKFLA